MSTDQPTPRVGMVLRGTETYPGGSNTKTIRITYVSNQTILAVDLADGHESSWTLGARPWEVVEDAPHPAPVDGDAVERAARAMFPTSWAHLTEEERDLVRAHVRWATARAGEEVDREALSVPDAVAEAERRYPTCPEVSSSAPRADQRRRAFRDGAAWALAARGAAAPTVTVCAICGEPIEHYDPTGDGLAAFWAHTQGHHPHDGHDAAPAVTAAGIEVQS